MTRHRALLLPVGVLLWVTSACGGGASAPTAPATPPPTPVAVLPTPTPSPSPSPSATPDPACATGLCEPPTTNTAVPTRVILRIYQLFDAAGNWVLPTPAPVKQILAAPIPVGYTIRFDVTGKDENGNPTNGDEKIDWLYSDAGMVDEQIQSNFQRKITILKPGSWELYVVFDGAASNSVIMKFCDPVTDPTCHYP